MKPENMISFEDSRVQLEAMVRQENRFYRCADYLEVDEPEPVYSPLHVVAECALLVTDVRSALREDVQAKNILQSPSRVNKFPSPTRSPNTSFNDIYSLSESIPQPNRPPRSRSKRPSVELSFLHSWRHQMLDWAFTVANIFGLDRDVVTVAFSILDRYVSFEMETDDDVPISRKDFQLYSMTAMYIAVKNVVPVRKLTMDTLVDMSRGGYTAEEFTSKERDILFALDWHLNPPTVIDFCRQYMRLFPGSQSSMFEVEECCRYIAEMALDDVYFISKSSSTVALAIFLLAMQRVEAYMGETHNFLENLKGSVSIQSGEFNSITGRLECLLG